LLFARNSQQLLELAGGLAWYFCHDAKITETPQRQSMMFVVARIEALSVSV